MGLEIYFDWRSGQCYNEVPRSGVEISREDDRFESGRRESGGLSVRFPLCIHRGTNVYVHVLARLVGDTAPFYSHGKVLECI